MTFSVKSVKVLFIQRCLQIGKSAVKKQSEKMQFILKVAMITSMIVATKDW